MGKTVKATYGKFMSAKVVPIAKEINQLRNLHFNSTFNDLLFFKLIVGLICKSSLRPTPHLRVAADNFKIPEQFLLAADTFRQDIFRKNVPASALSLCAIGLGHSSLKTSDELVRIIDDEYVIYRHAQSKVMPHFEKCDDVVTLSKV